MRGLEVIGFVRAHQKYRQVPIIIISVANGLGEQVLAALEAGLAFWLRRDATSPSGAPATASSAISTSGRWIRSTAHPSTSCFNRPPRRSGRERRASS
jgi:hypothetical protein